MEWIGMGRVGDWIRVLLTSELIVEAGKCNAGKREEDLRVVQLAVPLIFDRSTQ